MDPLEADNPARSRGGLLVDEVKASAVRSQLPCEERYPSTTFLSSPPSTGILQRAFCGSSVPDVPLVKYPSVDSIAAKPPPPSDCRALPYPAVSERRRLVGRLVEWLGRSGAR
jgi:hypothetical protein